MSVVENGYFAFRRFRRRFHTNITAKLPIEKKRFDQLVGILLIALGWQYAAATTPDILFPSLEQLFFAIWDLFVGTGNIYQYASLTMQQLLIGYSLAVAVALPLGLLMGAWRTFRYLVDTYVNVLFVTSVSSLLPFLIIVFGTHLQFRVVVVFLFGVFHMTLNFQSAMENVDHSLIDAGQVFGASKYQLYRHVRVPAALPLITAGFRLGIGRSIRGMIVAELWIFSGLGALLNAYQQQNAPAYVIAITVFLMLLGVVAVRGLYFVESKLAPWEAAEGQ